MTLEQAVQL
jgi:Retrotransposon gag protein